MEVFNTLKSTAIPLPIENIDTDQIIPARFLRAINKQGFGNHLFKDWRYHKNATLNESFVLNNPTYKGSILIAGDNFGCGSSREHAAWALVDYGFKVIISSFFADIFKGNALNNGLLPIQVNPDFLKKLLKYSTENPDELITINLDNQFVELDFKNLKETFEINPYKKLCLQNGYDDVDFLVGKKSVIEAFEKNQFRVN